MKYLALLFVVPLLINPNPGYKVGDKAMDFNLKSVDGEMVSLKTYKNSKGAIVIFTCNTCPYSKAYEDRIIQLHNTYKEKGYPVIAINPNDPNKSPGDSYKKMQERAKSKGFTFPYAFDETQEVTRTYGATNTPHVYVLEKVRTDFIVRYIGAIDDNSWDAGKAKKKYVEAAVDALLEGSDVPTRSTKAIGCTIKWS